jgi:CBS domain containing-hemolysin-like protein
MKARNFYPVSAIDDLAWPEQQQELTLKSPALSFFTDFKEISPLTIESTMPAIDVKNLMQQMHVHLQIVTDDKGSFMGIITSDDLIERRIVQKVSEGVKRNEVALTELMTSKKDLKALDYQEVVKLSISEVIEALKDNGKQHCLVVDRDNHKIRGIFSAREISKKLNLPIDIQDKASFYKVFSMTA